MAKRVYLGNSYLEFCFGFFRFLLLCVLFVLRLVLRLFLLVWRRVAGLMGGSSVSLCLPFLLLLLSSSPSVFFFGVWWFD